MPVYTFYACMEDGVSTCFETRELPYDGAAFPAAGEVLNDHPSAAFVAVWNDERQVLSRYREPPTICQGNEPDRRRADQAL